MVCADTEAIWGAVDGSTVPRESATVRRAFPRRYGVSLGQQCSGEGVPRSLVALSAARGGGLHSGGWPRRTARLSFRPRRRRLEIELYSTLVGQNGNGAESKS